jgi:hypothetical protein
MLDLPHRYSEPFIDPGVEEEPNYCGHNMKTHGTSPSGACKIAKFQKVREGI